MQNKRILGPLDCTPQTTEVSPAQNSLQQALKHLLNGRVQDAINACSKAIELDGSCAEAYSKRGTAWNMIDRHLEAIEDFDQAVKINPRFEPALFGRGFAYIHLQQF
jgi:tetratricopeptide (TPR) repeat protein